MPRKIDYEGTTGGGKKWLAHTSTGETERQLNRGNTKGKSQLEQRLKVDSTGATILSDCGWWWSPQESNGTRNKRAVNKQKHNRVIPVSCAACCLAEGTEHDKQPRNWRMTWRERRKTSVWKKATVFSLSVLITFDFNPKAVTRNSNWQ